MKAVTSTATPDGARYTLAEVPEPTVGPTDLLVEVYASAINQADLRHARTHFAASETESGPAVAGLELAGVVIGLGDGGAHLGIISDGSYPTFMLTHWTRDRSRGERLPLGYLDLYLTFSGFRILPTLARVRPDFTLTLNPREVTETFEVPLDFLMRPENHQRHSREWKGIEREYYAVPFGDRYIWGITAGIVRNLYDRIYG